jgi:predicted nucleotidyltransferase
MISLKSKVTQKILEVFFLNEKEKIYINEMAQRIDEYPANVYKKLVVLKQQGILIDSYEGKERYFFLNKDYPFLKEYKKIILKEVGFEKLLKDKLMEIEGIDSAYLFGSYAEGKLSEESDIDLLVVGDFNSDKFQKIILEFQKKSGREINSMEITKKEVEKRIGEKDPLLEDIFSKKHIKIL